VENTGNRRGKEVVQVYVRDVQSKLARPEKELKAFASVEIEPGETKTVNLTLGPDALAFYDPGVNRWVVEPGEFQVLVGHSAGDIRLKAEFTVTEDSTPLCKEARLHVGLALNTLLNDPAGKSILARYLGQHIQNPHLLRIGEISLEEIAGFSQGMLPNYVLRVINEELARV
jgi:beta-glucosidase